MTDDYDVVVDVLQTHYEKLLEMTRQNIELDMFNIMDEIRLEQLNQLNKAIKMWKNK
jgi:demethoxyubiquinone hydroxylase (CLK1/Coq7/Cat5 family)